PRLTTPSGAINIEVPPQPVPPMATNGAAGGAAARPDIQPAPAQLPDVIADGSWRLANASLTIAARVLRPEPVTVQALPSSPVPTMQPGEIAAIGVLVWDNGRPYLKTPSGQVFLTLSNPPPPYAQPSTGAPGAANGSSPPPALMNVIAIGAWSVQNNQLTLA